MVFQKGFVSLWAELTSVRFIIAMVAAGVIFLSSMLLYTFALELLL
jgi:hypothetical protein